MYNLFKKNSLYLVSYFVLLIAGLIPVLMYSKTDVHLFLNRFHDPFFDVFFKYSTALGSGITAVIISIILLFVRIRYSLILFSAYAGSGIIVQLLKHVVFPGIDRPVEFFKTTGELYLVQGVEFHNHFSFPSGHAATAFAIFGLLAAITSRKLLKLFFLFCAVMVSYSRVYLSQHFLEDILFGSVLGILSVIIFYWYFHRLKMTWADHPVQYYFRPEKQ
jgi:membrane-associated phospholipid phosphatase